MSRIFLLHTKNSVPDNQGSTFQRKQTLHLRYLYVHINFPDNKIYNEIIFMAILQVIFFPKKDLFLVVTICK